MNFKHRLGAASMIAAAWYSTAAAAADYDTQIYSVTVDEQNGVLMIDGVDLAPAGAPGSAHVQLLGQALEIHDADSSSTHLEAALPASVSLNPGTGYQLYVSPSRPRTAAATSPADQALFTLYVTSKVSGARATTVVGASGSGSTAAAGKSASSAQSSSSNLFKSLGSAFSLNSHSTTNSITGSPSPNDGSTFTLPYTGSLGSTGSLFTLTNTSTGDALDGVSASTVANAVAIRGVLSSTAPGGSSAALRGINNGTNANGVGVWGSHAGGGTGILGTTVTGIALRGTATTSGIGILASSNSGAGLYVTSNTGQGEDADAAGSGRAA